MQENPELRPEAVLLAKTIAGEYGDSFLEEFLLPNLERCIGRPQEPITEALHDAKNSLAAFYGHYAFARRGKERDSLSRAALNALNKVHEEGNFEDILQAQDGVIIWERFHNIAESQGIKVNETQDRGLLQGMLELAQEIYRIDGVGSVAGWMQQAVQRTGSLEPIFLRIVDIRGVGPKSTSTFMRDLVHLYDLERRIEPVDRIYVQPVDRWLRAVAPYLVPEPNVEGAADWIIAGKVSKYTRKARVSSVKFNMGISHFGQRDVRRLERFDEMVRPLMGKSNSPNRMGDGPGSWTRPR
jgi:hypothetical protein